MADKNTQQNNTATAALTLGAGFNPTPAPPTLAVIDSMVDDVGKKIGNVAKDGLTDDLRPTLNGHMEGAEGLVLKVWFNGEQIGTTIVDDSGHWTFTPPQDLLVNQEYYAQVSLLDPGSDAEYMSLPLHFYTTELNQDDDTTPDVATDLHLTDNVGPVQGEIANNGVTDDNTPVFSGKAEAGDIVIISDNGKVIGSVTTGSDGNWSFTPPTLKDGDHSLSAVLENPDNGKTGPSSAPIDFTVDTFAQVPVITGIYDDVGIQQGLVSNGGLTDDNTPLLQGTGEPGSTVVITMYGPVTGQTDTIASITVDAGGHWEYQFSGGQGLQKGNNVFHITETDLAGNTATGADYSVTLVDSNHDDMSTPAAATDITLTDNDGTVGDSYYGWRRPAFSQPLSGELQNGAVTNDSHAVLAGKSTAGNIVIVSDNGKVIGAVTVADDGNWSYRPESALRSGEHSFTTVVQNPLNGHLSEESPVFNATVKNTALTPLITGVYDSTGEHQGVINQWEGTDASVITVSGISEPDGLIMLTSLGPNGGGYFIGYAAADSDGKWTFTGPYAYSGWNGYWTISAQAWDQAGNTGYTLSHYTINYVNSDQDADHSKSAAIIAAYDNSGLIHGILHSGDITDDRTPTLHGTADAGSTVYVYYSNSSTAVGSALTDSLGQWSLTPATPLKGPHVSLTAIAYDSHGAAIGTWSQPIELDIRNIDQETAHVNAVTISYLYDNTGSNQGIVYNGDSTDSRQPTLCGTAEAGSTVYIYDSRGTYLYGSTLTDSSGHWSFTHPSVLPVGEHPDWLARSVDASGNFSAFSDHFSATIIASNQDTPHSQNALITGAYDAYGNIQGHLQQHDVTDDQHATLYGTAAAGSVVAVYYPDSSHEVGRATTDNSGHWALTLPDGVGAGQGVSFTALALDADGHKIGDWSTAFTLEILPSVNAHVNINNAAFGTVSSAADGHHTLTLTMDDVLNHSQQNMLIADNNPQLVVNGHAGDVVELKVADLSAHEWQSAGHITSGGAQYDVYHHAGDNLELLLQQGVELHQVS